MRINATAPPPAAPISGTIQDAAGGNAMGTLSQERILT